MTTPQDRLRSLKWGFELLDAVRLDARLDSTVRARAFDLLQAYPYLQLVTALRSGGALNLPADFQRGVGETRKFLGELRSDPQAPEDLKQHALYTQRHFPTPESLGWILLPGAERLIKDWIELPDTPTA